MGRRAISVPQRLKKGSSLYDASWVKSQHALSHHGVSKVEAESGLAAFT